MRVNLVRCFATLLGLTTVSAACADFGQNPRGEYVAPKKWSSFNSAPAPEPAAPALVPLPPSQQAIAAPKLNQQVITAPKSAATQPASTATTPRVNLPAAPQPTYAEYSTPTTASRLVRPVSNAQAPVPQPLPAPVTNGRPAEQLAAPQPMPMVTGEADGYSVYDQTQAPTSRFADAVAAPWDDCGITPPACCVPQRLPLSPWFGGGNVLLWTMSDNSYRRFLIEDGLPRTSLLNSGQVSPGNAVGYDVYFGRYFDCGRYGLSVNYLNFDPGNQQSVDTMPSYAAMPQWNQLSLDRDGAGAGLPDTVYDLYDGDGAHRIQRDVGIQGLELNLSCFGTTGARRLVPPCGTGLGKGPFVGLKRAMGLGCGYGYTSAGGPLERPCFGTAQVVMSHGFRWFQFKDNFDFSSSTAADGYDDPDDITYTSNVTNDLYGYQFGGRMIYCLGCRWTANVGAKAGIYGNDVFTQQHLGTPGNNAYVTSTNEMIDTKANDVVLAGLGELDLGLGYRICNGWSINGGYRMLYASGVATSIGSIPGEYYSGGPGSRTYANDSLLLQGAYIGSTFNW